MFINQTISTENQCRKSEYRDELIKNLVLGHLAKLAEKSNDKMKYLDINYAYQEIYKITLEKQYNYYFTKFSNLISC